MRAGRHRRRYDEGAELLINQLIDTRELCGNATDHLQALSQGLLGHLRFNPGKVDLAVGHFEQALKLCRKQNDVEGVRIYLSSLHESHRYLSNGTLAADYAQELTQAWSSAGDEAKARRFTRLSQLVRNGEPLLRVVAECDGYVTELDEVELRSSMKLVLQFWRNRPSTWSNEADCEGKRTGGKAAIW